jgi:NRAMP (natural resistance-associated macrophage protein)-like metal ion transporter
VPTFSCQRHPQIDPGNLEVDLQAGAALGYRLLSAILFTSIMGYVLQTLAAHAALATGFHLAELCCAEYPPPVSFVLFFFAMLSVVAFDVAEVIGTAFALQMLFGLPLPVGMVVSACDTMLILYLQRREMKQVEIFVEGLLGLLVICLFANFVASRPALLLMLKGTFVPDFAYKPHQSILLTIGILGSVVMSHNLFLHSGIVKKRRQDHLAAASSPVPSSPGPRAGNLSPIAGLGRHLATVNSLRVSCDYARLESAAVLFGSFLINGAVLCVAAAQFYPHRAEKAFQNIGLLDASALLHKVLGSNAASYAWGIALLASGHAATVTGTIASQMLCEGFLSIDPASSTVSLFTRFMAIIPAVVVALAAGVEGADKLIVACQIIVSFELPFAVIPLLKFMSHPLVTSRIRNRGLRVAGLVTFIIALLGNAWIIYDCLHLLEIRSWPTSVAQGLAYVLFAILAFIYAAVVIYLVLTPVHLPGLYEPDDELRAEMTPLLLNANDTL